VDANSISSSIVDKLSKAKYRDSSLGLAFFYCDGNYSEKQDRRYILGSIARQLLPPASHLFEQLKALRNRGSLRPDILVATIERIASSYRHVYIVIDGLDECANRESLLDILSTLEIENVNLFVTSRCEKDIELAFEGKESLEVDQECIQIDIEAHIQWILDNNKKLQRIKPDFKAEIKQQLAKKSAGM
jgi:ankyrin repeat domain-containing protein 50